MVKKYYGYIPTVPVSVDVNPCYNEKKKNTNVIADTMVKHEAFASSYLFKKSLCKLPR